MTFMQALATQRWDDHRFYHHSRINQSLHLVSALAFISAYALVYWNTLAAVKVRDIEVGDLFYAQRR